MRQCLRIPRAKAVEAGESSAAGTGAYRRAALHSADRSLPELLLHRWRRFRARLHRARIALHTRGWKATIARAFAQAEKGPALPPNKTVDAAPRTPEGTGGRRILIVDATTPRADRDSGSVRAIQLFRLLRRLGHAVDFLPDDRADAGRHTVVLRELGVSVHSGPQVADDPRWFAQHARAFDLVVVCRYHLGEFLIPLIRRVAPDARVVLDTVDLHFLRERREAVLRGDRHLLRLAAETEQRELRTLLSADAAWVVSAFERNLLQDLAPGARIVVLPNIHEPASRAGIDQRRGLLFIGGAAHPPNVDAVRWLLQDILPLIHAAMPGCELHVVGDGMNAALRATGYPVDDIRGVRLHGHVPDLDPLLAQCRVGVAPLRFGAGVKGKVGASMAAGMPVVVTSCAAEGMHLVDGRDALIADTAASFADAVLRLYRDDALWERLTRAGLENITLHFSRDAAERALQNTWRLLD